MAASLSPLAVINRATQLLARNAWQLLALIFGLVVAPGEAMQDLFAMKPLFVDRLGEYGDMFVRSWGGFIGLCAISALGYTAVKRVLLDDLDGQPRRVLASLTQGLRRALQTCWLVIPVTMLDYWLTFRAGFVGGLVVYMLFVFVLPHYAVAGQGLKTSVAASLRLFRSHGVLIGLNGVMIHGANFGVRTAYQYVAPRWLYTDPMGPEAICGRIIFGTLSGLLFAVWATTFYATMREQLDDQPARAAKVFD